ncbi:citrate transporter [Lactococcus hodotermopsidis]|uniref:Citrate transporter n=1 Tax=Pseudolactococcus hodotermopsidis TaxID=2709157 RepID=A0A6A0B997_9LACT|nr:citrate transporter [Lactococcus hodotermopsidis]GFH41932.1 citrate transporter [Lactococcus hodotermopsidis]
MFGIISGILLLATFLVLVVYCMKGKNLLIGFLVAAVAWCVIGLVPMQTVVTTIFQDSVAAYGGTIAVIVFGAWFGRVLVDTGIAGYIIKKTVELTGDKPLVTTLLINIVCMLIFTSAFGVGSVMAIGMIILPILMTLGIDKKIAAGAYMLAVAGGMWLNIAYVSQFFAVFPGIKYDNSYIRFGAIATGIHLAILVLYILFNYGFSKKKKVRAWAVAKPMSETDLKGYVVIVPFVPIVTVALLKWQPVPAFLMGIFLGLLLTGNLKNYNLAVAKVQKTLYDGVADSGLLIGMLYSVNIFQAAAKQIAPLLQDLLADFIPNSPVIILIAFCILAPLALFRGPLMIWGSGIALATILQAMGTFDESFLFIIFMIPPVSIVASSCPTQSWTMWALNFTKVDTKEYIKTNLPWAWVLTVACLLVGYFVYYL